MEKFISVQPKSELVKKHIAYYYFHSSDENEFEKSFVFYPNYKNAITIYNNCEVVVDNKGSFISPSNTQKRTIFYSTNIDKNLMVSLKGVFNKIGIVFNPLGLNHFIDKPLSEVVSGRISEFYFFGKIFDSSCISAFNQEDYEKKAMILDSFFEDRISNFKCSILENAVEIIIASNGMIKVEELSEKLSSNRRTLLRLFKKHLLCSIEEYKKLVKFRSALNFSQESSNSDSLTQIALFSQYYDQANFINQFKSIARESPKKVIPSILKFGNEDIYWKIIKS